jgi:hypothetical protein
LAGDFPKEVLTDRKARLETTIRALKESGPASWPKWKRKR